MKKALFIFAAFFCIAIVACNNSDDNKEEPVVDNKQAQADSLEKEVMDGHDAAMPKSTKIPRLQEQAQRMIDSIGKLPSKAKEAAAPLKAKLESLVKELGEAYNAMDKWMVEFKYDSARANAEQRIKYLAEEKLKIDKVKEAVLGSIAKADSLLKAKL